MVTQAEIERRIYHLCTEIDSSYNDAIGRLGNSRRVKLGDLNIQQ